MQQHGWDAEVLVVNDGSTDDTAQIVQSCAAQYPAVRLLENPGNRGKGYSVRNGMLHANGEVILFSDADLSSPIEEADKLFAALSAGADVAMGSRWLRTELQTQRQPLHRQLFGRIFNIALRPFWDCSIATRNAASRHSPGQPPTRSFRCSTSSAGASILKSFFSRASLASRLRKFP